MPRKSPQSKKSGNREIMYVVLVIAVLAVISVTYFSMQMGALNITSNTQQQEFTGDVEVDLSEGDEIQTLPDGTKFLIHPSELSSGGPPKGGIGVDIGISAITDPKFVSVEEADEFLSDDSIVFGVVIGEEKRAYTKEVLVFHEIVNDDFDGKPVLVTYCPLCGTAIAFDPVIDGNAVRFGTSGKLLNSNLVMYDELTESYWTQVGGKAIIGDLTGVKLDQISIDTLLYKDWKRLHPDSKILSRETGFARPYGLDPYGDYYINDRLIFNVGVTDDRLHPKDVISGIEIDGNHKAYPVKDVDEVGLVNDEFEGVKLLITKDPTISVGPEVNPVQIFDRTVNDEELEFEIVDGILKDVQTGSEWDFNTGISTSGEHEGDQLERIIRESDFWFNWVAFHPETELFVS